MGLQPGQVFSGGRVVDADGRVVMVCERVSGVAVAPAGGDLKDADGRLVVKIVQANT